MIPYQPWAIAKVAPVRLMRPNGSARVRGLQFIARTPSETPIELQIGSRSSLERECSRHLIERGSPNINKMSSASTSPHLSTIARFVEIRILLLDP
jgi:hypothetical protein